jgi:membrane associated rhomboid family serine protease
MRPPADWRRARVTIAIAALTVAAFLIVTTLQREQWAIIWGGFIPARLAFGGDEMLAPFFLTPLTATLVHGGWVHLIFNMLILLFCGRAVENVLGPVNLAILYVAGAYAAAAAEYLVEPTSPIPTVGASGAFSAVLGAYALLFGRNKVKVASPRLALWLHALWLMAAWVGLNLVMRIVAAGGGIPFTGGGVQVAIAAHIGGFVAGVVLVYPLLMLRYRKA